MKILITGANGQLGKDLIKEFNQLNIDIIPTGSKALDITNQEQVLKFILEKKPNIIINCAALTNVDMCESDIDNAYKINAIGPKNLAQAAYRVDAEIVHISTDYVFSGDTNHELTEFDIPSPKSVYGKSKLQGELFVKQLNPKHIIIRTSWLYGDGQKFVQTMLNLSKAKQTIKVVDDQYGTPTSTIDLVKVIIKLINEKNYGLFHCTCKGQCSRYDFAKEIFNLKNAEVDLLPIKTKDYSRPAMVPQYGVLKNYMLEITTGDITRDWKLALSEYIKDIK